MFETYNVPALYIAVNATLSLFASGRTTGVVLDSGYFVSNAVPIIDGHVLNHAVQRMDLGGYEIADNLQKILTESNNEGDIRLGTTDKRESIRECKEKHGFVSLDFERETETTDSDLEIKYELRWKCDRCW